jgi:hypothetical protein
MTVAIRRIEPRDEPRWRELFDGYTRFYEYVIYNEPSSPRDPQDRGERP